MADKYHVYRPALDLIGFTEGTDKGRGYNETLAYGLLTGGPVDLVSMTLDQVAALQARMLKHPANKWNSSAVGRYQIVGKTLRAIRHALNLSGAEKFDRDMQDRMGCYLLGVRGIDKYLAGRLEEDTLLLNHKSAGTAGAYALNAQCAAGSASINVRNITAGNLGEAIVIGFALVKAVTA